MNKRIIIDIGHPAHVHYFRNFIKLMSERGHEFKITSRDKEVTQELLKNYSIDFSTRGKGSNSIIGKLIYLFKGTYLVHKIAMKFKPDIYLSFASPYAAISSFLSKKPHIVFDDTDHATLSHRLYSPFSDLFLNPEGFKVQFKKGKQIFFKGYLELCYLHPNYFEPDLLSLRKFGIDSTEKYTVIRFVSWNANHDINAKGLSLKDKIRLVNELSNYSNIYITSEEELPEEFERYKLNISADKMHDVLAGASLFVGESGTMSTECAMLGVPNIQIRHNVDPEKVPGVHINLIERGLKIMKKSDDIDGILTESIRVLENYKTVKKEYLNSRDQLLNDSIDVTEYLCEIIETYHLDN